MVLTHPLKDKRTVITSKYGMRSHPVTGVFRLHNGIDLSAPMNTAVYSPLEGKVTNILWTDGGGNQLIIDHGRYGISSGYAHLNKILVKKGQTLKQGQRIALTGKSGRVTGPHLHFRLKNNKGEYMNPERMSYTEQGNPMTNMVGYAAVTLIGAVLTYKYVTEGNIRLS